MQSSDRQQATVSADGVSLWDVVNGKEVADPPKLDSPVNARPSTGRTGAPQPTTLHGIVLNPSVLKIAPINPPREPRPLAARLSLLSWARLSSHSVE